MAGIGRGDELIALSAFASQSRGIDRYLEDRGLPLLKQKVKMADIVSTTIETQKGKLITLIHDTTLPRPRGLGYVVQGTKGIWDGESRKIYLEGISPHETWEDDALFVEAYDHPLWRDFGAQALSADAHHQGMDYIMLKSLAHALIHREAFPATLRDLAQWCALTPLSERSIREGKRLALPL